MLNYCPVNAYLDIVLLIDYYIGYFALRVADSALLVLGGIVMKKTLFNKKTAVWGLAACTLAFLAVSCGRIGPCYVEAPPGEALTETARFYYFFDKTDSMRGFTEKGDESHYVQTLPLLWQAANAGFAASSARFFEYGTRYTNEYRSPESIAYVKNELLRPRFYGDSAATGGIRVRENGGQPFSAVADYIGTLNEPGSAYIVVTDLYEQNRENPFFLFFRDAFSRGLSGAFFAVESSFTGNVHSVSRVNEGKSVPVRDSIATFFLCIVGDSNIVYSYSAALAKEFEDKINFNSAVFLADSVQDPALYHGESVMAGSARRFDRKENAFRQVNLRPEEIFIINQSSSPPYAPESYQLLTKTGSRWTAGLALKNINPLSFKYKTEFSLSYFDGKTTGSQEPSRFIGKSNSTDVDARIFHISEIDEDGLASVNSDYPLYLKIETKNRIMEKGWYKISYRIVPEAIPEPEWISALNARDINELEESARERGGHIKVLHLADVYEKIAGTYNARPRNSYSNELYLLKR
jgi:hypothetical protein